MFSVFLTYRMLTHSGWLQVQWEWEPSVCPEGIPSCRGVIAQDRLPIDEQKYGLKTFQNGQTYILIIKNVDEKDEGKYYCQLPLTLLVKAFDVVTLKVTGKTKSTLPCFGTLLP